VNTSFVSTLVTRWKHIYTHDQPSLEQCRADREALRLENIGKAAVRAEAKCKRSKLVDANNEIRAQRETQIIHALITNHNKSIDSNHRRAKINITHEHHINAWIQMLHGIDSRILDVIVQKGAPRSSSNNPYGIPHPHTRYTTFTKHRVALDMRRRSQ